MQKIVACHNIGMKVGFPVLPPSLSVLTIGMDNIRPPLLFMTHKKPALKEVMNLKTELSVPYRKKKKGRPQ